MLVLPQRQPTLVAKQVATLDTLSGGRIRLGVGIGWQRAEYEALGEPFSNRGRRMDEAIALLRSYWTEEKTSRVGEFYNVEHMAMEPKSPQGDRLPIWIGGTKTNALKRVAKLGDGWMAMNAPGDDPLEQRINQLYRYAESYHRDPASIGMQMSLSPGALDEAQRKRFYADTELLLQRTLELKALGFDHISIDCVPIFQLGYRSSDAILDHLHTIYQRLAPALESLIKENLMTHPTKVGPLQDITIIDCTMAFAGPFGTALLADMGANVIKVEPPNGDTFRSVPPYPEDFHHPFKHNASGADYGMAFAGVNRNKRSICLDLKHAEDRETLFKLCESADAIVENMRAGVMDKLGLGFEAICERNAKIVYGAVRGYGDPRTGESPYAQWPCLDVAGQSAGGLVEATGDLFSVAIADIYPGTLMALGLVAAVHRARQTGTAEFFDVAMYDAVLTLLRSNVAAYSLTGKETKPKRKALVPFGLFPTADGRIAIAAPVERHWHFLCEAMGREDLASDERTKSNAQRASNQEYTESQISQWTKTLTKAEITSLLGGKVPVGPANSLGDVFADPHVQARQMLQEYQLPGTNPSALLAGNPIKFLSGDDGLYQRPPRLGEHGEDILREFNISKDTVKDTVKDTAKD